MIQLKLVPVADATAPFNPQASACMACGVRRLSLFGALDDTALNRIHHHIPDVSVDAGHRLYSANDSGQAVFTIREGVVRLERSSDRGERRIVRLAGRGDLVGIEAILGQTYAADAITCTPVKACKLPRALIDELTAQEPNVARDLMKRWQNVLDEADEWLTELAAGSARWRMLRLLLKLTEYSDADGRVWLPSRQEMGSMLGMTVETASRLVAAMRREELLELVDARHAHINMPQLMAALKEASDA